ncbi:hypothetical protein J2752_001164 [Halarchaeum rubridurum]|uniref:DUF4382 domain-containing protein n=1 Tax=Halarchaeum rubridurum TaxID=489911 RepID=A0A830FPS7_9EURY|nr:DUF4382 domain-containing protein [Halarchaeum rubridurum]MBP1954283.1 hypothetical protein [Halarchaeum rubridurum]GGM58812.1 hypothetical protein GCM10009017_06170 [Halarchaeum rubridurum]
MNRQGLLAVCLVALVALAGCAGGMGGGTTTDTSATSTTADGTTTDDGGSGDGGDAGTVATYVSDRPAAIDDFAHLNATVTRVGLHRVSADANATSRANASGWQTVAVNETVDLTALRGENATHVVDQRVPSGTYDNVFVYVSNVEGTLTDGSSAAVKLPSGKLHLATTFTVEANETVDFVYDLAVHETGNGRYILRPNAGESGPDQPIRVVGDGGASASASASGSVDLGVTENDSANANASGSVDLTVRETVSAESDDGSNATSEDETTTSETATTSETTSTTSGTVTANASAEATANASG